MFAKSFHGEIFAKTSRIITLIIVLVMVAGCGTLSQPTPTNTPQPTATNPPPTFTYTPVPTNTPLPTDTPVPTDTPTPLPTNTPTPDLQATRAFEATRVAEQVLLDVQAQLTEFGFPTDVGYLGWVQEETVAIDLDTYGEYLYAPFAEDLVASDFILRTDITWDTEGLIYCGLMFRSEPNFATGAQYSFLYLRLSGLPAWAIEYYDEGRFVSSVTEVKFSDFIDMDNGATNNLTLAAEGNKFTLFVNQQRVGSFYDWSNNRMDGQFAFQALQEAGPSTCTFENTWIWMLK